MFGPFIFHTLLQLITLSSTAWETPSWVSHGVLGLSSASGHILDLLPRQPTFFQIVFTVFVSWLLSLSIIISFANSSMSTSSSRIWEPTYLSSEAQDGNLTLKTCLEHGWCSASTYNLWLASKMWSSWCWVTSRHFRMPLTIITLLTTLTEEQGKSLISPRQETMKFQILKVESRPSMWVKSDSGCYCPALLLLKCYHSSRRQDP